MSSRVSSRDGAISLSSTRRMPLLEGELGHGGLGGAADDQPVAGGLDGDVRAGEHPGEVGGLGRLDDDGRCLPCGDRLDGVGGQELAAADHDEVVGEHAELADEVARHEHRAAAAGEVGEVVAQPADAVGVEAVGRLVEQQDLRVAEQGAGEGEALPHAEGEPAGALVGGRLEPDLGQHLVDPAAGIALMAAMARRWLRAVWPGCMQRASRTEPTRRAGCRRSV